MPSYRANIQETVELRLLDSAPSDAPKVLKNSTTPFRWIEERVVMQTQVQNNYLAPLRAVYALDPIQGQVVYANQCLTQTVCISWLSWPFPAKPTQQVGAK
jgi:cytochrome c